MKVRFHLIWILAVLTGVAHGEPTTRIGASYYYVEGGSALVLTAQMDSKGPTGADGRHHWVGLA